MTNEEKIEITKEMLRKEPLSTIAQVALLKMAEVGIYKNAKSVEQTVEATICGKRYNCSFLVTYAEINGPINN